MSDNSSAIANARGLSSPPGCDAVANAKAWYESICEMVKELEAAREEAESMDREEAAQQRIYESVLSVEVRSGWYMPGQTPKPEEYSILLTTGGPGLRLIGGLDEYGQPKTARLEYQDWGTPWTEYNPGHHEDAFKPEDYDAYDSTLLAFASCFYFGE